MLALGSIGSVPWSWRCKHLCKARALQRRAAGYGASSLHRKVWRVRCSSDGDGKRRGEGDDGEAEGWSLEGQVESMLGEEESKALIQDLNAAVERVAKARRDLDALEEQQRRATFTESLMAADSLKRLWCGVWGLRYPGDGLRLATAVCEEHYPWGQQPPTSHHVEECQRNVFAAELDAKNAEIALVRARAGSSIMDLEEEEGAIDRDAERVESGKAAGVAGAVGTLAGLPFFSAANLDGFELAVSAGIVFLSSCVFGLTYRYAVRRNLRNTQLKAGCVAAFSLVRSLDAIRLLVTLSPQSASEQLLQSCLFLTESIAIFCFAAVGLEYCFQQGFVSPFPLKSQ